MSAIVVFVTVPNRRTAVHIAQSLVKEKRAACVNIVPAIESLYIWQGKLEKTRELLLIIKTTRKGYPALERRIQTLHPYTVPEIIALPIQRGASSYLKWLKTAVAPLPRCAGEGWDEGKRPCPLPDPPPPCGGGGSHDNGLFLRRPRRAVKHCFGPWGFLIASAPVMSPENSTQKIPKRLVEELALRKAEATAALVKTGWVLGADTIVVLGRKILGKPADAKDAYRMLYRLSNSTHQVYTGVALVEAGGTIGAG